MGIILCVFLSGCGYVIEGSNPILPNEAKTIALLPIQNQTFKAGLETDLSEQFNLLLRSNSSVRITPAGIADLQLNITLLNLKTSSSGLSKEQISSGVKGIIQGQVFLEDRRTGRKVWEESALEVKLTESDENETNSVSSFSLSGSIRELIKLFAAKIYERLFTTF
ncbi:MAG: LPS assembly lipoprotein LptE [SAR324 cluster bacterium]|nr:LPS assembly lipoprotein LptE [SAR324 cluster bacterium]